MQKVHNGESFRPVVAMGAKPFKLSLLILKSQRLVQGLNPKHLLLLLARLICTLRSDLESVTSDFYRMPLLG